MPAENIEQAKQSTAKAKAKQNSRGEPPK